MSPFDSYQSNAAEAPVMRRWLLWGLIASVLIHIVLFGVFRVTHLERFSPMTERLVPRAFSVTRSEIELLPDNEPEPEAKKETVPAPKPIDIPLEKDSFAKIMDQARVGPSAPELAQPILNEKPKVDVPKMPATAKLEAKGSQEIEKELQRASEQLIKDTPRSANQALINLGEMQNSSAMAPGSSQAGSSGLPGYSDLDALLGAGALKGKVAPLFFPGGALFDFDKTELLPSAMETLKKLGLLIQKNPNATFTVEGYADSLGTPEHNQALSEQRAESVKRWLIENMGINPSKIEARGFGSTRFIVPPDPRVTAQSSAKVRQAEIDRQQPNRRVEIVITTPQQ